MNMREDIENTNRRVYPRVAWNTAVKYRPRWKDMDWSVSKIQDISVGGCYFESLYPYEQGEIMEIEIRSTLLKGSVRFLAGVKRCEIKTDSPEKKFGIAVQFMELVEDGANSFAQALSSMMKQMERN